MSIHQAEIEAVRAFNRFYTRRIGVLDDRFLDSAFSLSEVRVLYELAHRDALTAGTLQTDLDLDPGYLSRMLKRFRIDGLVDQTPDPDDTRRRILKLTHKGRTAFAPLDRRQRDRVEAMLAPLPAASRDRLSEAMGSLIQVLGDNSAPVRLRAHGPGDMGWIVKTHGELYAREYGWDERFEGLVARICADFIERFDPVREHCWIAERAGVALGCVMLVQHPDHADTGKLRLLLVAPWARGLGLGSRLVETLLRRARKIGYRRVVLWTNDVLVSARRIYEAKGFELTEEQPHESFGKRLVGQTWRLDLG
ncbi:MAG TPA: helix-turn-helix domain-containing GNAT family N-acetyltransferase [Caulobacteraceae bacterium]|jgi:DNA-binding MarR family transcriptional regulator/N-acetylglutamate synthase-like GNAT family acetyltransferase|nr:helix-turn-helix domain-containing GNAT family N-acetyltransferase [Caulobacteraceae bacterium]